MSCWKAETLAVNYRQGYSLAKFSHSSLDMDQLAFYNAHGLVIYNYNTSGDDPMSIVEFKDVTRIYRAGCRTGTADVPGRYVRP